MSEQRLADEPSFSDAAVLVLDDDPSFARSLVAVLQAKGYEAIETHTGRDALALVADQPVAVAVIDFKLDDIPGIEVLRGIKRASPLTECILLTGYASQDLVIDAINEGGFGFLQKPCDLDQLLVLVRRAMEKHDAVEALRESEEHTRAILHASLEAVVTTDELGTVVDWNPRAEATLGWSRREALGKSFRSLVFGADGDGAKGSGGLPVQLGMLDRPVEAHLRHKDGRELAVEWAVTLVDAGGRRTLSFFIRDLTARKRLEEQFLQAQRTETLNLLAGGVLHDFNNVLTAVMGQSALLQQDPSLGPQHRQVAQEVLDAAQRASVLTRQLLAYSEPKVRRLERLELNAVVLDLGRLLKRALGERIHLEKRLAPSLSPIEMDRGECQQVILNLVLNARDALPKGGTIHVETAEVEHDRQRFVELTVRDNGVGMSPTTRIRAFEPFFTTKEMGRGVGLGLTTVAAIVEAVGGRVSLESELGHGTTCRVALPAREGSSTSITLPRPASDAGGSETLLVVEDEAMVRSTVVRALRRGGYVVLEAGGGEEALRVAAEHGSAISLLISDVIMPQMNGKELATRLLSARPDLKVLFMSGYTGDVTMREGVLGKDVELLAKPFTPRELLDRVRRVLDSPPAG